MLSSLSSSSDVMIQPGPSDTTSDIAFCPIAEFVAATSWDNAVSMIGSGVQDEHVNLNFLFVHRFACIK